jgi:hypothetical protein
MRSQFTARSRPSAAGRAAWGALFVFAVAFAALEVVKHGMPTLAAALLSFVAPDLTLILGAPRAAGTGRLAPRAVPLYNAAHRAVLPFALLVLYSVVGLVDSPPVFGGLLGWLGHIALDRAAGHRLRSRPGYRRA